MPFIDAILDYKSLSIVGLEKNSGKTESLNFILRRLPIDVKCVCVTSIGLDGERVDQVVGSAKPEIRLPKGVLFATSEKHYKSRKLVSELLDISDESTSLGRVVTARVVTEGKVLLSGPSSTASLKRWMDFLDRFGVDLTIVDGALSRMSLASPAITQAMILSTGAALSSNISTLVNQTAFVVEMINLPLFTADPNEFIKVSSLSHNSSSMELKGGKYMITGALTDGFLRRLILNSEKGAEVVVKDFTRIFISPQVYRSFISIGGSLTVEQKSKLIAISVNPTAPTGFVLDSDRLCERLSKAVNLPVYDIVKNRYED